MMVKFINTSPLILVFNPPKLYILLEIYTDMDVFKNKFLPSLKKKNRKKNFQKKVAQDKNCTGSAWLLISIETVKVTTFTISIEITWLRIQHASHWAISAVINK